MKNYGIFATLEENGRENSAFFDTWDGYHAATFCPDIEVKNCVPMGLRGRTYRERQSALRELAIEIQCADVGGLSWGETARIASFFEEQGKKYGLLREFRENAIC